MGSKWSPASGWLPVILVFFAVAASSLCALRWWSSNVVDPWAAKAARCDPARDGECEPARMGELRDYSVPGTYGDAFAPVVGVLTSLALAAAVASTFMQREEMSEARKQFTAQARAQEHANVLATEANVLARSAQLLEVTRQLAELDQLGTSLVEAKKKERQATLDRYGAGVRGPEHELPRIGDPAAAWDVYARASFQQRAEHHANVDSIQMRGLAERRLTLERTLDRLRAENTHGVDAG